MQLIVGLGNPDAKYQLTRHNIGFMVIDGLAQSFGVEGFKREHKALTTKIRAGAQEVVLLVKPQTYMNLSGESVQALMNYYNIGTDDLLVIHDEVELPFESIRYQKNRGHGGHNGIRHIHKVLSSKEYSRLRLGVSRPANPRTDVANFVLQNFSNEEMKSLPDFLRLCCESVESYIVDGFEKAATKYNRSGERK